MDKMFRAMLMAKLVSKASLYDDVKKGLENKGFKLEENKPVYGGTITIPAVKSGVSVTCPNNPIINGKYNVFFQIRAGHNPTQAGVNTIIVQAEAGGSASSENTKAYGNTDWVKQQLGVIQQALSKKFGNVSLGKLGLGSFSGGYEAVGKIIQDPELKNRIDSLVILDGIHEGKRGQPSDQGMKKWLDFAEQAKKNPEKKFIFAYTAVDPEKYASTSDSAYYLTDKLGAERKPVDDPNKAYAGVKPASIANAGGFTAIQMYDRKNDQPGYGYIYSKDNKPGSMGHQHVMAAKALPDIWGEYLSDWNS